MAPQGAHRDSLRRHKTIVLHRPAASVAEPILQEHVWHTKTHASFVERSDTGRHFAENTKEQTARKKTVNNVVALAEIAVEETEDFMIFSYTSEEDSSVRNEVFTTLDVICPRKRARIMQN